MKCTDTFMGEPLTLEIDIKACRRPVKIDFELDINGQTFRKEFDGDQDIPLPGLSIGGSAGLVLNVNANARNNGDLQLKVRVWNCAQCLVLYSSNHHSLFFRIALNSLKEFCGFYMGCYRFFFRQFKNSYFSHTSRTSEIKKV